MVGAVDKHLALIGFMGAGKSTLGRELAQLTDRPFVDTDEEIEKRFGPIGELFERGEPEFRRVEEQLVAEALAGPTAVDSARWRCSSVGGDTRAPCRQSVCRPRLGGPRHRVGEGARLGQAACA